MGIQTEHSGHRHSPESPTSFGAWRLENQLLGD